MEVLYDAMRLFNEAMAVIKQYTWHFVVAAIVLWFLKEQGT